MMKIMKGAFYVLKIIRSQLYQLVVDKAVFLILLIYILMDIHSLTKLLSDISLSGETVSGGKAFALWSSVTDVIIMLMTALIMVKDQSDKTINYEILSGKSRASVFFGRYVTAFGLCALLAVIEVWSVPIAFTVKNGWGSELKFSEALIRTLLILMFVFRVSAETAMFSVLFKKRKALVFFAYLPVIAFDSMLTGWSTSVVEMSDSPKKMLDWMNKQSRSSVEMNDPECRPEIAGELPDCSGYDSVVIGYPIWWYTAPKIIRTFLERADLKGKRIDLFATSGSSGIGKSVEELQKDYPELQIVSGKLVNKRIDAADIRGWLA